MPLKIIRQDITKVQADAIVNTANPLPGVGAGCDRAIYQAAGYDDLLKYRREKIGYRPMGSVFVTPGFQLPCKYIIHAVSPRYVDGHSGEEEKLRKCYESSIKAAIELGLNSIAFPLISTGSFAYPKEEGMRIALDEINRFMMLYPMQIYLVVFDEQSTALGRKVYPDLQAYIDKNYVEEKLSAPSWDEDMTARISVEEINTAPKKGSRHEATLRLAKQEKSRQEEPHSDRRFTWVLEGGRIVRREAVPEEEVHETHDACINPRCSMSEPLDYFSSAHESALSERIRHLSDTFSEYLIYLIESKGMTYPDVYKRAIVDKKAFSKIKNNPQAHPKKITAMCLCVGAQLNLDQTKDLLARAGYALSPCDKTDIIFSYFIENGIYDMIELDIQLEEHGLPCLIS